MIVEHRVRLEPDRPADRRLVEAVRAVGVRSVARSVGLDPTRLSRWLAGRGGYSLAEAEAIASAASARLPGG